MNRWTDGLGMLVEFIVVAVLVGLAGFGGLVLTLHGAGTSQAAGMMTDMVKEGFAALVALAYASGKSRPETPPTPPTTTPPAEPAGRAVTPPQP